MASILIVDDNPDICRALAKLIRRSGYEADWAAGGREAIEALRDRIPDLVILDEMMPGVDGLDVLRAIRADERTSSIPVVIFTAMYDHTFRDRAVAAGANDVWIKGNFDLDTLSDELAKYVPAAH